MSQASKTSRMRRGKMARRLLGALALTSGAWLSVFLLCRWYGLKVGDIAAVLQSLFAALAFAGVIVAIILQSDELRMQRRELKLTTDELRRQANTLGDHSKLLAEQRFESTFFNGASGNRVGENGGAGGVAG